MTALGKLSAIYVAAASAYAVAVVLAQNPDLAATAQDMADRGAVAAGALYDQMFAPGGTQLPVAPKPVPRPITAPKLAQASAPVLAVRKPRTTVTIDIAPLPATPRMQHAPPRLEPAPPPAQPAPAPPHRAQPPKTPERTDLARAEQRLEDALTPELHANFDLFVYVSKAVDGPLAQHMYVFAKNDAGALEPRYDWPVSTGREALEENDRGWKLSTATPVGYYELDPKRMYRRYRSVEWDKRMPYSMFFNWVHDGRETGIAIHAAEGEDIALLGQRASGGCIHLSPKNAGLLFRLIHDDFRGEVPRFAYDRKTATMSNHGQLMRGADGKLRFTRGYKVLIYIENYGGGNDVVAALM